MVAIFVLFIFVLFILVLFVMLLIVVMHFSYETVALNAVKSQAQIEGCKA